MTILKSLKLWLILAITITILSGLIFVINQQSIRQAANDPQIQIAEDVASLLSEGRQPGEFDATDRIDLTKSLSPYVLVYDNDAKVVAATAQLDGNTPTIPKGVLDTAKKDGQDRVTWEPKKGVRSALVVVHYGNGYVAVGRSLREIESREMAIALYTGIAWLASIIISLGLTLLFTFRRKTVISEVKPL